MFLSLSSFFSRFLYYFLFCLLVNTTAYLNVTVSNPSNARNRHRCFGRYHQWSACDRQEKRRLPRCGKRCRICRCGNHQTSSDLRFQTRDHVWPWRNHRKRLSELKLDAEKNDRGYQSWKCLRAIRNWTKYVT